ncbi:hypothetical protein [Corynebacterium efficiens YS-314]|uniref:Uncharacterized protein n=1 Tax=Corynebacterium efficiens (strain DSM 44549 / YS-314 / AJ 12310 / JCM 11189 / NBRC 100395) TaxID=196164 RepID=Q8FQH6_COREF|nr:hypothetical protein [Corynebacterium efficiens YS-314]
MMKSGDGVLTVLGTVQWAPLLTFQLDDAAMKRWGWQCGSSSGGAGTLSPALGNHWV